MEIESMAGIDMETNEYVECGGSHQGGTWRTGIVEKDRNGNKVVPFKGVVYICACGGESTAVSFESMKRWMDRH